MPLEPPPRPIRIYDSPGIELLPSPVTPGILAARIREILDRAS